MMLPSELLNKSGQRIRVSAGTAISPARLARLGDVRAATDYLRARTHMLGARSGRSARPSQPREDAIAAEQSRPIIGREIAALPPVQRLLTHNEYTVCYAAAVQIPAALLEIGRLREITFRTVGEGTGRERDLDRFDRHYDHLILWNNEKQEIAGACRIAKTGEGKDLYTSTLFKLRPDFYQRIHPALGLGRSFVRPQYQKGYLPLLLLWKGLGHYVAAFPQYRVLFGPVSITNDYSSSSRQLMVDFLTEHHSDPGMSECVRPRKKFHVRRNFSSLLSDLDDLSAVISDLEDDRKGIPILLQHYLQLGGRILEFSVDPRFSNALDGLILVDLTRAKRTRLNRYMGKERAADFLAHHDHWNCPFQRAARPSVLNPPNPA
ncbi:MAG TPA: GNAT family N-acyltransferase [Bryobacteraceae bacterium]|nr:GNAT family N-acyltransferase [Bryobacteraceae bacterium]